MDITKKTQEHQYNENVKSLIHLISHTKAEPEIMGSASMKFNYASDYDLFTVVTTNLTFPKLKHDTRELFLNMATGIKQHKDEIYFIEFMCGVDKEGKSLKWTLDEIIKGRKDEYSFYNVLDKRSIIKIEVVGYIDSKFIPMSNVFEFKTSDGKGINQAKTTLDTVDSLKKEVKKYHEKKIFMKVLKRLFIISLVEKNISLSEKLIDIFQSDIGKIYKVKSDVDAMKRVLELYDDKTTINRIHDNIQLQKETIATQSSHSFNKQFYDLFDDVYKSSDKIVMLKSMEEIITKINNVVNTLLKTQITKNKISYKKYL